MKRIFYLLGIALLASRCATDPIELSGTDDSSDVELQTSQTRSTEARSLERVDGSLFVVEYGKRYSVDPNVITVKYKPGLEKSAQKISKIRSNRSGYIDIRVPEGVDVEEYVRELEKSGEFSSVEYNTYGEWCYSPNDTRIGEQWYLTTINAQSAWNITAGSSNVKVAIIDSGVDVNHPDLGVGTDGYSSVDASLGWNYITNSSNVVTSNAHGTRVAGILAAKTNNSGRGIAGVAGGKGNRGITMIPYCVGIGAPDFSVVDDAIYDAVSKGARVIQLSLEGASSSAMTSAINYATQNNVVVVCASGNHGGGYYIGGPVSYPASLSNVIAVGATNRNETRWSASNYGTALDVVAPGVDILSTTLNGGYNSQDGTSFAAPQVSAIAALILSKYPDFTRQQVVDIIQSTANRYPSRNNEYGYGLVDAHKALFGNLAIYRDPHESGYGDHSNIVYTYRVTNPPTGVSFSNWSITPNYYTVTGGTNIHNLTIKFTKAIDYTLTANFTLPNGGTYSATKTVSVTPPKPDVVAGETELHAPYLPPIPDMYDAYYWIHPDNSGVMFALGNYNDSGLTYEWESEYLSPYTGNDPYYTVDIPDQSLDAVIYKIKCRAKLNGRYSQWAEVILYVSESLPQPYRAPADSLTANYKLAPSRKP